MAKVKLPPFVEEQTKLAAGSAWASGIGLLFSSSNTLWLRDDKDKYRQRPASNELMNAVEMAWASDKLGIYFFWNNSDAITDVVILSV